MSKFCGAKKKNGDKPVFHALGFQLNFAEKNSLALDAFYLNFVSAVV